MILDIVYLISTVVFLILAVLSAVFCASNRYGFYKSVTIVSSIFMLGAMVQLLLINAYIDGGAAQIIKDVTQSMKISLNDVVFQNADKYVMTAEELSAAAGLLLDHAKGAFLFYFPALIIILSIEAGYVVYRVTAFTLKKLGKNAIVISFSRMKAPKSMTYTVMVLYFIEMFSGNTIYDAAISNMVIILYAIIGVCGISFIDYWLKKAIKSKIIRFFIYFAALITQIFTLVWGVIIILGMFDSVMNYRKIGKLGDGNV